MLQGMEDGAEYLMLFLILFYDLETRQTVLQLHSLQITKMYIIPVWSTFERNEYSNFGQLSVR